MARGNSPPKDTAERKSTVEMNIQAALRGVGVSAAAVDSAGAARGRHRRRHSSGVSAGRRWAGGGNSAAAVTAPGRRAAGIGAGTAAGSALVGARPGSATARLR
jgi:hypothetical protein